MGSPLAPALADVCMNWVVDEVIKKRIIQVLQYLPLRG